MHTLNLRPAVILAVAMLAVFFIMPIVLPDQGALAMLGAVAAGLLILLWWLFISRALWGERLGALALIVVAVFAVRPLLHPSIAGAGMGLMFYFYAIPLFALALVAGAAAARRLSTGRRRAAIGAAIVVAAAACAAVRTDGVTGGARSQFHWRWTPTAEQRLLAQAPAEPAFAEASAGKPVSAEASASMPAAPGTAPAPAQAPAHAPAQALSTSSAQAPWPGFRGRDRNSVIAGVRLETDWTRSAPAPIWRRPVGPGWSSFAIAGDLIYTQEQRGDHEIVAAYRLSNGEPVWMHRDRTRFYESNAGPGPRGTPAAHDGRVYALGATGVFNALDAATGAVIWSRNVATDAGKTIPGWGFASSPLIVDDMVIVAAAGKVVAYERHSGNPRWMGPDAGGGYSSPHLLTIAGVRQIVHLAGRGARGLATEDGKVLWEHAWEGTPMLQPALTPEGDLLIATGDMMGGVGMRRIAVTRDANGWSAQERWTSRGLKPYFNDYVIHKGHAFGFDGNILSCIDLADGARKWKGGRYGNGQMILLADQDLLLVMSEDGDLALVSATPDTFTEVAKIPALNAKTWNHPVLLDDVLLIRNGEEMAAYKLATLRASR